MWFVYGFIAGFVSTIIVAALVESSDKRKKPRNNIIDCKEQFSRFSDRTEKAPTDAKPNSLPCSMPCHQCITDFDVRDKTMPAFKLNSTMMIVCETCGNKRCPHASNHRLPCSGSNEPDQPGSVFCRRDVSEKTLNRFLDTLRRT